MKWLIRLTALLLALDLAAGLFGVSVALRSGGASLRSFVTPSNIAMALILAACLGAWCWLLWRAFRSPWNAPAALATYLGARFGLGLFMVQKLDRWELTEIVALNVAPLIGLAVALLALWKPPKEPDVAG